MVEGWITAEAIEFCTIDEKAIIVDDNVAFRQALFSISFICTIDEKAIIVDDNVAFRQALFSISFISVNSTTRSTLFVLHLCHSISSSLNDSARYLNTKGY
jgi:hypothetical protein